MSEVISLASARARRAPSPIDRTEAIQAGVTGIVDAFCARKSEIDVFIRIATRLKEENKLHLATEILVEARNEVRKARDHLVRDIAFLRGAFPEDQHPQIDAYFTTMLDELAKV